MGTYNSFRSDDLIGELEKVKLFGFTFFFCWVDFGKRLILGWGLHQKDKNVLKTSSNTFNIDGFCNQTLLIGKHGGIHHSPITATFIKIILI